MARPIKLNSKRKEPKRFKIRRKDVLKKTIKRDNSLLRPSTDLSKFSTKLFYAIKKNNKQLSNSDNYLLNLLCSEMDIYLDAMDQLNHHGLVTKNGKKSPYYAISKQSVDEITKLSNELDLTPKNRITTEYQKQSHDDPVKQAVDGDNE